VKDEEGWAGPTQAEVQECWAALRALAWTPQVQAAVTDVLKRCVCVCVCVAHVMVVLAGL
jgi:hypothetical protein